MDRREAVKYISLIMGSAMVGGTVLINGCRQSPSGKEGFFSDNEISFLDEIGETIIPTTDSPGAKAAKIGAFMSVMVNDIYDEAEQQIFIAGMTAIQEQSLSRFERDFMQLSSAEKHQLLNDLDVEQKAYYNTKRGEEPPHFFRMMKELTLLGYFTSEIGCTQARRYTPVAGKYEGCLDYSPGDKAWVY